MVVDGRQRADRQPVTCDPTGGGIVVGNVQDANTNGSVNGAVVTRDGSRETAITVATPEDAGLDDGFYWLYSSADGTRSPPRPATTSQTQPSTSRRLGDHGRLPAGAPAG